MKRANNSYLTKLVSENLYVEDFIQRLRADGYLMDGEKILLGAKSAWLFIGNYDEYQAQIDGITEKILDASDKGYKSADRVITALIEHPVRLGHDLTNYADNLIRYGTSLKGALKEKQKFADNIKLGVLRGRKVVEAYNSTYVDKGDVMIRVDGHEVGRDR